MEGSSKRPSLFLNTSYRQQSAYFCKDCKDPLVGEGDHDCRQTLSKKILDLKDLQKNITLTMSKFTTEYRDGKIRKILEERPRIYQQMNPNNYKVEGDMIRDDHHPEDSQEVNAQVFVPPEMEFNSGFEELTGQSAKHLALNNSAPLLGNNEQLSMR